MIAFLTFLAQAATPPDPAVSVSVIVAIAGPVVTAAVAAILNSGRVQAAEKRGEEKGRQLTSTVIENQPLMVKMAEEFVSRREFERLEGKLSVDVTDMKGLFERTMQAVSAQNTTLTKKIENLGDRLKTDLKESNTSHQTARGRIHNNVNRLAELLAALATKVTISDDIRSLVAAIREEASTGKDGDQ